MKFRKHILTALTTLLISLNILSFCENIRNNTSHDVEHSVNLYSDDDYSKRNYN